MSDSDVDDSADEFPVLGSSGDESSDNRDAIRETAVAEATAAVEAAGVGQTFRMVEVVADAVADAVAALPEGKAAVVGVTLGTAIPVIPVAVAMIMKKEVKGATSRMLAMSAGGLTMVGLGSSLFRNKEVDAAVLPKHINSPCPQAREIIASSIK